MVKKSANTKLSTTEINNKIHLDYKESANLFLSVLYGMCIVLLAAVFKVAENIDSPLNLNYVSLPTCLKINCS